MHEHINDSGMYDIRINGRRAARIKNMITNAGLAAMAKAMAGIDSLEVKYLAIGSSSAAVAATQTKLGNETGRFAVASRGASGAVATTVFNILAGEGIGQIEELGIIVGDDATGEADTGTLLSRVLWSHDKSNSEEITITRTDTFGRA